MRTSTKLALGAVAVASAGIALGPGRAAAESRGSLLARRVHYLGGFLHGQLYRLLGGRPDPKVSDDILADRVRSKLGSVTKELDLPRVHVMVTDHVVLLHGDVATADDAAAIEDAAQRVAGVRGVVSLLHEGLLPSDTRPSEGLRHGQSDALRRLLTAARDAGCGQGAERPCVRAVLAVFFDSLPLAERERLIAHLPLDVRRLTPPPRRAGETVRLPSDAAEFVRAVTRVEPVNGGHEAAVVTAVVRELHDLVPEEVRHVAALLPPALQAIWGPAVATDGASGA